MDQPRLNLLVLRSADFDRAAEFYERIGLKFEKHSHDGGPVHYAHQGNGVVFEIYPLSDPTRSTVATRLGFVVASLDDLIPKLEELGGRLINPAEETAWGRRAVIADLDGHCVELTGVNPA